MATSHPLHCPLGTVYKPTPQIATYRWLAGATFFTFCSVIFSHPFLDVLTAKKKATHKMDNAFCIACNATGRPTYFTMGCLAPPAPPYRRHYAW